jgi:hypothetical protein
LRPSRGGLVKNVKRWAWKLALIAGAVLAMAPGGARH